MQLETRRNTLPFLGSLARSSRPDDRRLWLRIATDYFLREGAVDASRGADFTVSFMECLSGCADGERLEWLDRLLAGGNPPTHLILAILSAGGDAADEVLAKATGLPRERLLEAALYPRTARILARRNDLDPELVADLLDGADLDALVALASNARAPIEGPAHGRLVTLAKHHLALGDRRLAESLLARPKLAIEAAPLFLEANPKQRVALLMAAQRAELGRPRSAEPPAASRDLIEGLEQAAMEGELELFALRLGQALGCTTEMALRIGADKSGEPLAIALSALGAANDICVRVLTATDLREGGEYRRVGSLARLREALFPAAARRILDAILEGSRVMLSDEPQSARAQTRVSPERRPRETRAPVREEGLSPAVHRRRRAFALLAAHGRLND